MSRKRLPRLPSGISNFDALAGGGVPRGSVIAVGGPPGAGKSISTQQICFHNAGEKSPVLFFSTLSEPSAKTLLHLSQFAFFDRKKLDAKQVHYVDIGGILRGSGLEATGKQIMTLVKKIKPAIVVIDSFKVFDDLAQNHAELRKFGYELAVNLMAWQATTFLLGEFGPQDIATNPIFSIVDGLIEMTQLEQAGEHQRFLQVIKMRGTQHSRDKFAFEISDQGIDVFASRLTIRRKSEVERVPTERAKTGIFNLDALLGEGIPVGSTVIVSGAAGTGKTLLLLEFLYRGAQAGEKGILFSFEETPERLLAVATGLGLDLWAEIKRGMIEIVYIPQPEISVEKHILMAQQRMEALKAKRVAFDSVSVFLHKITDLELCREKVFQIASLIQNVQAVGLMATDIPYGSNQISRFGVEETVVDGVILLSATEEIFERERYIEIYKLRNTAHLKGRHNLLIERGGMRIYPRYYAADFLNAPPPPLSTARRLSTGVSGLDALVGGGLLEKSITLVSGSAGIGKSTLGVQFLVEGTRHDEKGLFVALEEGPEQIVQTAEALGLPLKEAQNSGHVEVIYLSRRNVRANQYLAILTERIQRRGVRRLVLDGVGGVLREGMHPGDLRQMLSGLTAHFKMLGVTSLLTLEARSLHDFEFATEEGFSPVADNLILLRYQSPPAFTPQLTVIKTRGSAHELGAHSFRVEQGGIKVGG